MARKSKAESHSYDGILAKPFRLEPTPFDFKGPITPKRAEECARAGDRQVAMRNKKLATELEQRVRALFKHFDLEQDDWRSLALRLAVEHVPGFRIKRTLAIGNLTDEDVPGFRIVNKVPGAHKDWDPGRLARLLQQVMEYLIAHPRGNDLAALRELRKKNEWKQWKLETLQARLHDAKKQHHHVQGLCEEYLTRLREEDAAV